MQIQPELITLNPMDIVHVNHRSKKGTRKEGQNDDDDDDEVSQMYKKILSARIGRVWLSGNS